MILKINKVLTLFVIGLISSVLFLPIINSETLNEPLMFNDYTSEKISKNDIISHEKREINLFSEPELTENEHYSSITLQEADTYLKNPGQPVLPVISKTYSFPIGTTFTQVLCTPQDIQEKILEKEILFASKPFSPSTSNTYSKTNKDNSIYDSNTQYPSTWYNYNIGVGLDGREHVTYLTIQLYPVRYSPAKNIIQYSNNMEITITYETPKNPVIFPDEYDLVIISPTKFTTDLQPLITHKENMNIKTKLYTTEDIYQEYEGKDQQEKIKYFIKHAIEEWGVSYVLLFGGMNGQNFFSWHVPIQYSYLCNGGENRFISDLYYSDIYKYDDTVGFTFDDWDSNNNNICAEWYSFISSEKPYTRTIIDMLDMYPDVYIGRLPCRYKFQVKNLVNRIINYETTTYGKEWFKKMVVLGGDSANESLYFQNTTDYYEGELMNDHALSFMDGFDHIRIWPEGGDVVLTPTNAETILSEGEGFVYFAGHGDPFEWLTHPHGEEFTWIKFTQDNIKNLKNKDMLPIMVVSGCHNCQFDTGMLRIFTDGFFGLTEYLYLPKCWGWQFASYRNGGSIATIGHTGTSYYGATDGQFFDNHLADGIPDCIQYFDGWLEPHFFELYNHDGLDILGQTHGQAITDYLHQFPIDWTVPLGEREKAATTYDCKTVQEWVLLGDPSLKIGGYPNGNMEDDSG